MAQFQWQLHFPIPPCGHDHVRQIMWYAFSHKQFLLFSTFLFPSFWYNLSLVSPVQRLFLFVFLQNNASYIRCFLPKLNLNFLVLNVSSGLNLVGCSSDTPVSSRMLLTLLDAVKMFFFTVTMPSFVLWSFRTFCVVELISAFIFFNNPSHCWFSQVFAFSLISLLGVF